MKKIAFFLTVLFTLTLMVGCNDGGSTTVRFNSEGTDKVLQNDSVDTTTITPLDDEGKSAGEPLVIGTEEPVAPPSALPSVGPGLNGNILLLGMGTLLWAMRRKLRQA